MHHLFKQFNELKTDADRWQWVIDNQDKGVLVNLDNGDTYITIDGTPGHADFEHYLGWSEGVFDLLDAIGIRAEGV